MKPLIRASGRRGGFTLVELCIVIAILMLIAGIAINAHLKDLEKKPKCLKIKEDMLATVERCRTEIDNGSATAVAIGDCIRDGQALLDKWCNDGCGEMPAGTDALITGANTAINRYRETVQDANQKARIVAFTKPC